MSAPVVGAILRALALGAAVTYILASLDLAHVLARLTY